MRCVIFSFVKKEDKEKQRSKPLSGDDESRPQSPDHENDSRKASKKPPASKQKKPTKYKKNPNAPKRFRRSVVVNSARKRAQEFTSVLIMLNCFAILYL